MSIHVLFDIDKINMSFIKVFELNNLTFNFVSIYFFKNDIVIYVSDIKH